MSVRLRLTLWHTALLALVLSGFALLVYAAVARQLTNELEDQVRLGALTGSRALRAFSPQLRDPHRGPRGGGGDHGGGPPPRPPPGQAPHGPGLDPRRAGVRTAADPRAPPP